MTRLALASLLLIPPAVAADPVAWPFWEQYARAFVDLQGRVIAHDEDDRTTSEGQAYALFFSLVANDRTRFDKVLAWTEANLARGDVGSQLPAWHWGKRDDGGWGTLDPNSASDADLWIAYTLIQAGSYWNEPRYETKGRRLAALIEKKEVADLPGFGPMLLPGPEGFISEGKSFVLNPSYLPLSVVYGLAAELPQGPWKQIAERIPRLMQRGFPRRIALDWISYSKQSGFTPRDLSKQESKASYDAIRAYLWVGVADPNTPGRKELVGALDGILRVLEQNVIPPGAMNLRGEVITPHAGPGYSAALIPFLEAAGNRRLLSEQQLRWTTNYSPNRLVGDPPRYYEQNLALFAAGWLDGRYQFDKAGRLILTWSKQ